MPRDGGRPGGILPVSTNIVGGISIFVPHNGRRFESEDDTDEVVTVDINRDDGLGRWVDLPYRLIGINIGSVFMTGVKDENPNVCADMADVAQAYAKGAIAASKNDLQKALEQFDQDFSNFYVGRSVGKTYKSAYTLWRDSKRKASDPMSLKPRASAFFRGVTGFKDDFRDSNRPDEDQTHHFAAYLSTGINGQLAAASAHMAQDVFLQANVGDGRLGDAAYLIGKELRDDPRRLANIGKVIRERICK